MSFRAQGMRAWLLQRLTAVYIAVFMLTMLGWVISAAPLSFAQWHSLLTQPWMLIALIIFYLSLFVHAWVGVRDILVDYVNHGGVRLSLLVALALSLNGMALWLLLIVIGLVK